MAVIFVGGCGCHQQRGWRSLSIAITRGTRARADSGKGRRGHKAEGVPVA